MSRTIPLGLLFLVACSAPAPAPEATPEVQESGDGVASEDNPLDEVKVGDWATYGDPEDEEWPTEVLDDRRWARVTAELACSGRAHHGDPDAHAAASRRILAHHKTTAAAVMDFGIEVNAVQERALALGELVATATERCR